MKKNSVLFAVFVFLAGIISGCAGNMDTIMDMDMDMEKMMENTEGKLEPQQQA